MEGLKKINTGTKEQYLWPVNRAYLLDMHPVVGMDFRVYSDNGSDLGWDGHVMFWIYVTDGLNEGINSQSSHHLNHA